MTERAELLALADEVGTIPGKDINEADILGRAEEALRASADAGGVREALEDCVSLLELVERPAFRDPDYNDEVRALGERIGFGAMMSTASYSWREKLRQDGNPVGGEFVAGPCHSSVVSVLTRARAALAAQRDGGDGWRDISTAPKDGAHVLVCDQSDATFPFSQRPPTVAHWFGPPDLPGLRSGGWYLSVSHTEQPRLQGLTHWRPLPTPPIPTRTDGGEPSTKSAPPLTNSLPSGESELAVTPGYGPSGTFCEDCPPVGYETDRTRCLPCPRSRKGHWNVIRQFLMGGIVVGEIRPGGEDEWWDAYAFNDRGQSTLVARGFEYESDACNAVEVAIRSAPGLAAPHNSGERDPSVMPDWAGAETGTGGGVESKVGRSGRSPLEHASGIACEGGQKQATGKDALADIAQAVKQAKPAGSNPRISEQPETAYSTDRQIAGVAPGPSGPAAEDR